MVVEGWIPSYNLRLALEEFQQGSYQQIILTSILLPPTFEMHSRGGLLFDLTKNQEQPPRKINTITVQAYSTAVEEVFAHFSLMVNDSMVGEATTRATPASYAFDLKDFPDSVEQITIRFNNNERKNTEDRNLYIQWMQVDDSLLEVRSPYVRYDRGKIDGRQVDRTDLFSQAEVAREELKALGFPDSLMVVVNAPDVQYNRTYTSALAVRKWMQNRYSVPPSFNIFTESVHARRTWLLYRKAFEEPVSIGIVASPSTNFHQENWWKVREGRFFVAEQLLKYIYAKCLFFPT